MEPSTHHHSKLSSLTAPTNIVVATDLSDTERLLPHAIAQAKSSGAQVTLVHAIAISDEAVLGEQSQDFEEDDESQARQVLTEMARRIEHDGVKCSIVIGHGLAVDIVQREIDATGATRLIIGTHAHGHAGQQILGLVANALLRSIHIPVFVIGPHTSSDSAHLVPRVILHPVSLAGQYRESASLAFELACTSGADLILLHVLDSGLMRGPYLKEFTSKANDALAELIPARYSPAAVHTVVECGEPVQEVLKICSETESDWIVMGIERDFQWWSKSNNAAYQVIAQAECPVLIVRAHTLE